MLDNLKHIDNVFATSTLQNYIKFNSMSKKSKKPGVCMFCHSTGVTKQHIMPDWLKSILPRGDSPHTQIITEFDISGLPNYVKVKPNIHKKREPYGAKKIREVCAKCNSGWMSRIESSAKPILTELILGNQTTLDTTRQEILSIWTVMTSIVAEYSYRPTLSIPSLHRVHLMKTNTPPENWFIWIGVYSGDECNQRYRHHSGYVGSRNERPSNPNQLKSNTQFSSFWIGSLFIHAVSSTLPLFSMPLEHELDHLIQIWPRIKPNVTWPPARLLSDELADYVADELSNKLLGITADFHRQNF